ncbi:MAG: class I SAM-dependent methyltransferase [Patescibacteria group bacterium]|jgi:2-polyprenyl-3-methyl-5-hydroxy-6-metoxy-1,4-benzoquinol methylase
MPIVQHTSWEDIYQFGNLQSASWFRSDVDPDIEKAVTTYGQKGGRVLDVGCGMGMQTIALAKLGYPATGIDVSPTAIHHARQLAEREGVEVTFTVANFLHARFPEPFSIILDRAVLQGFSVHEHELYMEALQHACSASGIVIVKTLHQQSQKSVGPHGYDEEALKALFAPAFSLENIWECSFSGHPNAPKNALCAILRREA